MCVCVVGVGSDGGNAGEPWAGGGGHHAGGHMMANCDSAWTCNYL